MANEDTTLEFELAKKINAKKILTVGGSGSRALPFLALDCDELTIVDVSSDQLLFIELKLATIKYLSFSDTLLFWTDENDDIRNQVYLKLKTNLSEKLQQFFQFQLANNPHIPPLYWGKWEKTFATFAKLTKLFFSQEIREGLFCSSNPYEFYQENIKGWKWNLLLKIIGNKSMFNSLLYKGSFIKKNSSLSYFDYYYQAFDRLFALDVKRSHFLQLCLCGKVLYPEALPIEFTAEIFNKIKSSKVVPIYEQGSIFERKEATLYDFVSLSDVPSYLSGEVEKKYIKILAKNIANSGVIVNRFYLRTTEGTDVQNFSDVTGDYNQLISNELVQMYQVQILQKLD